MKSEEEIKEQIEEIANANQKAKQNLNYFFICMIFLIIFIASKIGFLYFISVIIQVCFVALLMCLPFHFLFIYFIEKDYAKELEKFYNIKK